MAESKSPHQAPLDCALTGTALLNNSIFNKGSAFTRAERRDFDIAGLLPANVQTLDEQVRRAYEQYCSRADKLAKNSFLASLKRQNEVLYYKLVLSHIGEMFSVIYTPTEGDVIRDYSRLFRRPEGCFLNIDNVDRVYHDLSLWGSPNDIDYIIVTDGEEILGIGDQGVGGGLISTAKGIVATLCAGIHPNRILPVGLDCGTDNEALLNDDLYLGLRRRRVRGGEYDEFVEMFVKAARELFPRAYIHFEDFGVNNARRLLEKYRPRMACFNDDVQGTGCVTLAAIMAALHVTGETLGNVRMVVYGAGSAGVGIADQVRDAMAVEGHASHEDSAKQIWLIDKPGLLTSDLHVSSAQRPYVKDASDWNDKSQRDLLSVIKRVHPHVLIGTSTVPGAFTEEIVKAMYANRRRPIIFPLSNPTRLHEAKPVDLLRWTDGRALVATGSPFDPVRGPWGGGGGGGGGGDEGRDEITVAIAECNNSVIFPGICLGCVLSRAKLLTDTMLVAATRALAMLSPALKSPSAPLLPDVTAAREASVHVARAVIRAAVAEGVAAAEEEVAAFKDDAELEEWIRARMWEPAYRPLRLVSLRGASRAAKGEMRRAVVK